MIDKSLGGRAPVMHANLVNYNADAARRTGE